MLNFAFFEDFVIFENFEGLMNFEFFVNFAIFEIFVIFEIFEDFPVVDNWGEFEEKMGFVVKTEGLAWKKELFGEYMPDEQVLWRYFGVLVL